MARGPTIGRPRRQNQAKKWPVAVVSFQNKADMNKAVRYMQSTAVKGREGVPFKVAVWETTSYVKPEQRFMLENDIAPAGWVTVNRPMPLAWTVSTCDLEYWCLPQQLKPDHADQSIAPLCTLSWDIEVRNGTAEDRKRMKSLGLDKFPSAREATNQVIQISVNVRTVDGRLIPFLLELDDDEHRREGIHAARFGRPVPHAVVSERPDMICCWRPPGVLRSGHCAQLQRRPLRLAYIMRGWATVRRTPSTGGSSRWAA